MKKENLQQEALWQALVEDKEKSMQQQEALWQALVEDYIDLEEYFYNPGYRWEEAIETSLEIFDGMVERIEEAKRIQERKQAGMPSYEELEAQLASVKERIAQLEEQVRLMRQGVHLIFAETSNSQLTVEIRTANLQSLRHIRWLPLCARNLHASVNLLDG